MKVWFHISHATILHRAQPQFSASLDLWGSPQIVRCHGAARARPPATRRQPLPDHGRPLGLHQGLKLTNLENVLNVSNVRCCDPTCHVYPTCTPRTSLWMSWCGQRSSIKAGSISRRGGTRSLNPDWGELMSNIYMSIYNLELLYCCSMFLFHTGLYWRFQISHEDFRQRISQDEKDINSIAF